MYTPTIDWSFMFQRPQQIMRQFARHEWRVIYVNKTVAKGRLPEEVEPNLWVYHSWEDAVKDYPEVDVLYTTWAKNYTLCKDVKAHVVLYDSLDDFPDWEPYESKMVRLADVVVTSSQILYDKRSKEHPNVHLVRNGCDPDHINAPAPCPEEIAAVKSRPIIGFIGAVGSWVDASLIEAISEKFPTVVVGPEFGNTVSRKCILAGMKPYALLPGYYQNIDIGILPFKNTRVAHAANPIKMYEYLAAGKPVVASPLFETGIYPDYVHWAGWTPDSWIYTIQRVIKDPKTTPEEIKAFARRHSWENRFYAFLSALGEQS